MKRIRENNECIYPLVDTTLTYVRESETEEPQAHLCMRCILRKRDSDNVYWNVRVKRECLFKDDDDLVKNVLGAANWFHMDVYMELILGKIDHNIIYPETNESIYELDADQRLEKNRLKEFAKKLQDEEDY